MKRLLALATLITISSPASFVQAGHVFEDYAHVISATPRYEEINRPREVCRTAYEPDHGTQHGSLAGPIIGGIAGGVLGAQVGNGSGRVAASAAGAAIGAIVGDRLSKRNQGPYREREVTRCEMIDQWETRLTGYHVVYRYRGHTQDTMLPYDPGRKLALRVAIEPLNADHQEDDAWNR